MSERTLAAEQCRAARALLGWSRENLADRCAVANSTLADFEAGKRAPYARTLADVRRTLEEAGIAFIAADEAGGPGVRLQRQSTTEEMARP